MTFTEALASPVCGPLEALLLLLGPGARVCVERAVFVKTGAAGFRLAGGGPDYSACEVAAHAARAERLDLEWSGTWPM